MGLKSIEDIENEIENDILNGCERFLDDRDREFVLVLDAKDLIASDMAAGLLGDNDIEVVKRSDGAAGVFGVTIFPPKLYVPLEDFERASAILAECGFYDEIDIAEENAKDPDFNNGDDSEGSDDKNRRNS